MLLLVVKIDAADDGIGTSPTHSIGLFKLDEIDDVGDSDAAENEDNDDEVPFSMGHLPSREFLLRRPSVAGVPSSPKNIIIYYICIYKTTTT